MSIEKKNKGRDPAAQANDSPESRLVQKFLQMHETDYVRNVVIPVLEAEGFEQIDFHHGSGEVGKDLIFFKNEPFGKKSLVVAVVKPDRLSKSASNDSGFPVYLIQTYQAKLNEVYNWDGTKQCPDEVLVIFADDPSHNIINSNPGGLRDIISKGVKFILGSDIAASLLKHRKDIAEQILESILDTSAFLENNPTNLPLLLALHSNEHVDIQSIFTDLDAAVGTTTIAYALSLRPTGVNQVLIEDAVWPSAAKAIREIEMVLGSILIEPLDAVERTYSELSNKVDSSSNRNIWEELYKYVRNVIDWAASIGTKLSIHRSELSTLLVSAQANDYEEAPLLEEAIELCTQIGEAANCILDATTIIRQEGDVQGDLAQMRHAISRLSSILVSAKDNRLAIEERAISSLADKKVLVALAEIGKLIEVERQHEQYHSKTGKTIQETAKLFVPPAKYDVKFDAPQFQQKIETKLESLVHSFHSEEIATNRNYAHRLLEDTHRYLSAINSFTNISAFTSILKPHEEEQTDQRLSACILGLLNSGANILLTGNAGSGKSTTLEMFARRQLEYRGTNDEIIFLPLAKLAISEVSNPTTPDYNATEFRGGFTIDGLCLALSNDGISPGIQNEKELVGRMENTTNTSKPPSKEKTIEWLNDILKLTDLYEQLTKLKGAQLASKRIELLKKNYNKSRSETNLKILNRILLEEYYPQKSPMSLSLLSNPLHFFCEEVSRLFSAARPGITPTFVSEKLRHAERLVLVLDGVDEALGLTEWIIKLIEALKAIKSDFRLQIVASSRFNVPLLEEAGLFQIQLLPFRREQTIRFIKAFLDKEPDLANDVVHHLECHPAMFSVARTPLMSTILCVLARNGVVLPETKNALYKERFELLWGAYDAKKQVHRVNSTKSCLEDVSKKAAYYLHAHKVKSASRDSIFAYVKDNLARKYQPDVIRMAFAELERPCNLLVSEIDGTVGFGHLSYQEYLVSDELYTNRMGDILVHLSDPWWRDALVLVAMKTEDIGSIIEQRIMQVGEIGTAITTLNAMIEVSSPQQKSVLKEMLSEQKRFDSYVDLEYNEDSLDEY